MINLVMIADDFTGALDSGVQFARAGLPVLVVTDFEYDMAETDERISVLVYDAESRHIPAEEAYARVYRIAARAKKLGVPYLFKKTDSALRGNVGSELKAVLDASGEAVLPFFPALPGMNRVTKNGVQYIGGVPVSESVFGQDPFNPVKTSYVPDLIREQCEVPVSVMPVREESREKRTDVAEETITAGGAGEAEKSAEAGSCEKAIEVYDAESTEDMIRAAEALHKNGRLHIMAGCAGLASVIPAVLGLKGNTQEQAKLQADGLFILCGSVNPISVKQLDYGEAEGFFRQRMTMEQKMSPEYWSSEEGAAALEKISAVCEANPWFILDNNDPDGPAGMFAYAAAHGIADQVTKIIPENMGIIVRSVLEKETGKALMIIGGDTLMGIFCTLGVSRIEPMGELFAGIVLSKFVWNGKEVQVITKSGGFGEETLLRDLAELIQKR